MACPILRIFSPFTANLLHEAYKSNRVRPSNAIYLISPSSHHHSLHDQHSSWLVMVLPWFALGSTMRVQFINEHVQSSSSIVRGNIDVAISYQTPLNLDASKRVSGNGLSNGVHFATSSLVATAGLATDTVGDGDGDDDDGDDGTSVDGMFGVEGCDTHVPIINKNPINVTTK
jgi:hypothetical protein